MTERNVVTRTRSALLATVARHEWPTAESKQRACEDLLAMLAEIPYDGDDDDDGYVQSAWTAACALMEPRMAWLRRVLELLQLETTKTVH
jgi:hypothetical protein